MHKKLGIFAAAMLACASICSALDDIDVPKDFYVEGSAEQTLAERVTAIEATEVGNALPSGQIIVGNGDGVSVAVTPSGDMTIDNGGTVTVSRATGSFTVGTFLSIVKAAATVTNLATITPTASFMVLTPSDTLGGPQTNVLAPPGLGVTNRLVYIYNAGPTNIVIADSGTVDGSGTTTLTTGDVVAYYAIATNLYKQLSEEQAN